MSPGPDRTNTFRQPSAASATAHATLDTGDVTPRAYHHERDRSGG